NQRRSRLAKLRQRQVDVVHLDADMVQAFSALFEKPRHAGVRRGGANQLDAPHAVSKDGSLHLLTRDLFNLLQLEAEHVAVEGDPRVKALPPDRPVTNPFSPKPPRGPLLGWQLGQ